MRRGFRRRRGGASALEFALTLPIVVGLVSAVLDYGWFLAQQMSVIQAARDAVRLGVTVDRETGEDPVLAAVEHATEVLEGLGISCVSASGCTVSGLIGDSGSLEVLILSIGLDYDAPAGLVPVPARINADFAMAMEDQ